MPMIDLELEVLDETPPGAVCRWHLVGDRFVGGAFGLVADERQTPLDLLDAALACVDADLQRSAAA